VTPTPDQAVSPYYWLGRIGGLIVVLLIFWAIRDMRKKPPKDDDRDAEEGGEGK
jgi:hypothetical protein